MANVWVAMSGGVDSSVAAALLVEQGHEVTGVTMQLLPSGDDETGCCSLSSASDARRVCDALGIRHVLLNYREAFEQQVVTPFAAAYARGTTPNPCIECNDRLKFSSLLAKASLQGAEALATGHYARVILQGGRCALARGLDAAKDQSYFLYRLTATQLEHVMFPLGELMKPQVRTIAATLALPTAAKTESQDVCFVASRDRADFVGQRFPDALEPGEITNTGGAVLGAHHGIAHYTVGQRKGLGVGGFGDPLYVKAVDPDTRRVMVGSHDELAVTRIEASDVVWHGEPTQECESMVRYRMKPQAARAAHTDDTLTVEFSSPLFGVAPGQSVVCYRDDVVLGGGIIRCTS